MKQYATWIGVMLFCISGAWAAETQPAAKENAKGEAGKKAKASAGYVVKSNLPYVKDGDKAQVLDLYLPEKPGDKALPVVVWIHGGGWRAGSKTQMPLLFLVKQGYAVASVEYRFSSVEKFPAQIQDCQAALRWLRANSAQFGLNKEHIGVGGSSAGGHLAALVGTTGGKKAFKPIGGNEDESDQVLATLDMFGPTNFNSIQEQAQADPKSIRKLAYPEENAAFLMGATLGTNKEKEAAASAIHYVGKDTPPFLILHGDADHQVPMAQSVEFYEALKKEGVEATFQKMPGSGHGGPMFSSPEAQKLIAAFFDKHLKGKDVKVEALAEDVVRAKK